MNDGKDYTHRSWLATAALIAVLVCVSLIPPRNVGGVSLRRANILSDLIDFGDEEAAPAASQVALDEEEFRIDLEKVAEQLARQTADVPPELAESPVDTLPEPVQTTFEWTIGPADTTLHPVCANSLPQEMKHPDCRDQLSDNGGKGSALYAHLEYKNK